MEWRHRNILISSATNLNRQNYSAYNVEILLDEIYACTKPQTYTVMKCDYESCEHSSPPAMI